MQRNPTLMQSLATRAGVPFEDIEILRSLRPCWICEEMGIYQPGTCKHRELDVELAILALAKRLS